MVTKVTLKGKPQLQIIIPGAEAEAAEIMKALTLAANSLNDNSQRHLEARETILTLLYAMLPQEEQLVLPVVI
jgi:hypothetical protein